MPTAQERYDDAMFDFSQAGYDACIAKLRSLLADEPDHFDAQLSLGMAYYRKGDYATAIAEGHKAEKLQPKEQLVHTNLSLFYMKAGDKKTAEHHGLQARIASWRGNMAPPGAGATSDPELQMAKPAPPPTKVPENFPEMPWKKKPAAAAAPSDASAPTPAAETAMKMESEFISVVEVDRLPPGQGRTVHVRGREFAVFNLDGEFYAIDNTCTHKGGPLGAGTIENGQVFCPLHGWAFDVKTGACIPRPDRPVASYPTRVQDGQVQICI